MDSGRHLRIRQLPESLGTWPTSTPLHYAALPGLEDDHPQRYLFFYPPPPQSQPQLPAHEPPQHRGHQPPGTFAMDSPFSDAEALSFHQSYTSMAPGQPVAVPHTPVMDMTGLLQPPHILPSQSSRLVACLACGKAGCHLNSHRLFSKHVIADTKGRLHPTQDRLYDQRHTPVPASQTRTRFKLLRDRCVSLTLEQSHMLSLWTRKWSPVDRGPERHLFPTRFIDRIMPAAKTHTALFHALTAYAEVMWSQNHGLPSTSATGELALAVDSLSATCSTADLASTDEAILSALLLMLIYMVQGEMVRVQTHIDGLAYLVKLRGGLHYIGLAGMVTDVLLYADYQQATFFGRMPVWSLPLPPLDIGPRSSLGAGFGPAVAARETDTAVAATARVMCKLATLSEMAVQNLPVAKEGGSMYGSYTYLASIVEYQLAVQNVTYWNSHTVNECVVLALILFNQVVLHGDEPIGPAIRAAEHRFWGALEVVEKSYVPPTISPCLHIWLIMMGLSTCIRGDCAYRASAVDRLRVVRIRAATASWDQVKTDCLDRYVWLRVAQEGTYRRVWTEVEGAEPSRACQDVR